MKRLHQAKRRLASAVALSAVLFLLIGSSGEADEVPGTVVKGPCDLKWQERAPRADSIQT